MNAPTARFLYGIGRFCPEASRIIGARLTTSSDILDKHVKIYLCRYMPYKTYTYYILLFVRGLTGHRKDPMGLPMYIEPNTTKRSYYERD